MKPKFIGLMMVVSLLTGCANPFGKIPDNSDPTTVLLQRSADSIQQSLTQLSEAEQYEKMHLNPQQPRIYAQVRGMEQVVTMPWHGTLEQAVTKLASYSGFRVKFMGRPPITPILVQINTVPATVSDHMQNIGIQAGSRADIVIGAKQKIVEVRYAEGGF